MTKRFEGAGARGMADALYFYDPDEHNIETRTYQSAVDAN
jgi:hypothetical protein